MDAAQELSCDALQMVIAGDTTLVERAQGGDTAAFELLYRQNVGRIYAVCLRIVRNSSRAEELTQQAFVRAWEMLRTFRRESAFSTWLHRIALNIVLADLRSQRRRGAREEEISDLEALPDGRVHAAAGEFAVDIETAVATLPPRARAVFTLHDIEGFRHSEIAEQMGVTIGTCKAQLHRARKLLKEVLE